MRQRPRLYAVRRLNPFLGTTQVVELGDARALSLDGVRWEIQVRCAQPEHTWRSPNQGEPVMRYLRFGGWSREAGLRRVPVSPILDLDLLLGASAALTEVLPACLDELPFALEDRFEQWLLDREGMPFALIASSVSVPIGPATRPEHWSASAGADHSFRSARLVKRGIPPQLGDDPRHHSTLLQRLVRNTAGHPARIGWFERGAGGAESAAELGQASANDFPRRLATAVFPPLLLREVWSEASQRDLVRDYLDWCAPYLLTLPDLPDPVRAHLEQAARLRALEVDAVYRLYPKILDSDLLKSIRVEARIRKS